jgi:luciferase family oxidoreductase group 1
MRRDAFEASDQFPQDVVELMHYLSPAAAGTRIQAVPGTGLQVPVWILGSSTFGAQLAAELGLPYAFASHFAPAQMMQAIEIYRARFKPSAQLGKPYVMLGFNIFAADSDEEGKFLATSMQQAFVNLRSGRPSKLQPPKEGYAENLSPPERAILAQTLTCAAIGSPDTVRRQLDEFIARTGADELMVTSQIYSHAARMRSYELAAGVRERAVA